MPIRVSLCRIKEGQPKTFYIYEPIEFIKSWSNRVGIQPEDFSNTGFGDVILFYVSGIKAAVITSALFVRELKYPVTCTYYDTKREILYLYYGGYDGLPDRERTYKAKEKTLALLDRISERSEITSIKYDKWGERLFYNQEFPEAGECDV